MIRFHPIVGVGDLAKKGERQPTLHSRLTAPETVWVTREMAWYDGQRRTMDIATGTAWWFHYGKPAVPIRWVLIRDPQDEKKPMALLCTDDQQDALWIVECFVKRW